MKETQITIPLSTDQYQNVHLLLHNLIELTSSLAEGNGTYSSEQYKELFSQINTPLKHIKATLEVK